MIFPVSLDEAEEWIKLNGVKDTTSRDLLRAGIDGFIKIYLQLVDEPAKLVAHASRNIAGVSNNESSVMLSGIYPLSVIELNKIDKKCTVRIICVGDSNDDIFILAQPVDVAVTELRITIEELEKFKAAKTPTAKVEAVPNTSPSGDEIPGKMPRTAIGKLAIKAAWQIESETKKTALPFQVIERLQSWEPTEPTITKVIPNGVEWQTKKIKPKPWDCNACEKAIKKWNESRP